MTSTRINRNCKDINAFVADYAEFRTGKDLLHWSAPIRLPYGGGKDGYFGNHYISLVSDSRRLPASTLNGKISALLCHNATDVMEYPLSFEEKN